MLYAFLLVFGARALGAFAREAWAWAWEGLPVDVPYALRQVAHLAGCSLCWLLLDRLRAELFSP